MSIDKDKEIKKHPGGRPTKYKPEYAEQVFKLCLLGATDAEIADFFEVAESTVYLWKLEYPEFSEAIKNGKLKADADVANRLYNRAMGYSHEEDKIFQYEGQPIIVPTEKYYPPDTTAAIFWLKNRQPKRWRDRVEHTGADGGPIAIADISDDEKLALIQRVAGGADKDGE
jgi:hypothetical protein